jgi:outer membrane protein OmpA-like peptidoglycan-associated protein
VEPAKPEVAENDFMKPRHESLPSALFLFMILIFSTTPPASETIPKVSVQPIYIDFLSGRPIPSESIFDATSFSAAALAEILQSTADMVDKSPGISIEVIGFTDDKECADSECSELSLRRAKGVYEWLITHGVPATRLRGPKGAGNAWPLEKNGTEEGRSFNRRVQLDPILEQPDGVAARVRDANALIDYELHRIEFRSGHPNSHESLEQSAKQPAAEQLKILTENMVFVDDIAGLAIQIVGATDSHECSGAQCRELSLRRARCVYLWLMDHGFPASKLKAPRGDGADYPIGDNNSEEGRQQNRRVQLEFVPL